MKILREAKMLRGGLYATVLSRAVQRPGACARAVDVSVLLSEGSHRNEW